jgi:ubiquitin carboxyl-terminal hydrolase 8
MSIKFDSFMFLSVPIPRYLNNNKEPPTLEECVEEFTKEEILDGENKWNCPKCKSF